MNLIRKLVLVEQNTTEGKLKGWWKSKYEQSQPTLQFENRTIGGLIREYYEDAAIELNRLRDKLRKEGLNVDLEVRITELERLFSDDETDLQHLDADESLENWNMPRSTGDPLVDKWEAEISHGEIPNLDEEI